MSEYPRRIDSPLIGREVCVRDRYGILTGVEVTLETPDDDSGPVEQIWAHLVDGSRSYAVAVDSLLAIEPADGQSYRN